MYSLSPSYRYVLKVLRNFSLSEIGKMQMAKRERKKIGNRIEKQATPENNSSSSQAVTNARVEQQARTVLWFYMACFLFLAIVGLFCTFIVY